MRRTTSITIGDPLDSFIDRMLKSGRYGSTSEIIRSAIRLLEQQETQQELLRKALVEGEASGECALSLKEIAAQRKAKLNV